MKHLIGDMCARHLVGVAPDMKPFFTPGCRVCEAKKLAGKVTGNEPLPVVWRRLRAKGRTRSSIAEHWGKIKR